MTDKEWLKNITTKDLDLNGNVLLMLDGSVLMLFEDYYWLIKQAKRVQELEQQNKRYREYLELIRKTGIQGRILSTGEIILSDEANLAEEALEGEEIEQE